jgi:hypothetical protein
VRRSSCTAGRVAFIMGQSWTVPALRQARLSEGAYKLVGTCNVLIYIAKRCM